MSVILYEDPHKVIVDDIFTMVREQPNNMELGELVREYYHNVLEKEKAKKTKK